MRDEKIYEMLDRNRDERFIGRELVTSTNTLLLPCPFCGGKATIEEVRRDLSFDEVRWSAGCTDSEGKVRSEGPACVGYMSVMTYPRKKDAIAAWNSRSGPAQGVHAMFPELQLFDCGKHPMIQAQHNCPWCEIERFRTALTAIVAYEPGAFRPLAEEIAIYEIAKGALDGVSR